MKHSIFVKFVVFFLTACSLVAAIAGCAGIVAIESAGLYVNSLDELQEQQYKSISQDIAKSYATLYAVEQLSNMTYTMRQSHYTDPENRADRIYWTLCLQQADQILIAPENTDVRTIVKEYTFTPMYPMVSLSGPNKKPEELPPEDSTAPTQPQTGNSAFQDPEIPENYLYYDTEIVWEGGSWTTYYYYFYEAPEYTVTVYMQPEVLESSSIHILTSLYPLRYGAIALLVMGLLFFGAGMVFLCWCAGRNSDGAIRPGGLCRLPLDLYCIVVLVGGYFLFQLFSSLQDWVNYGGPHPGNLSVLGINLLVITLLGISFIYVLSAQLKVKDGYLWKHSMIGFCLHKLWLGICFIFRGLRAVVRLLPVIWQWVLMAFLMAFFLSFTLLLATQSGGTATGLFLALFLVGLGGSAAIVCYGGYCFGTLLTGAEKMSRGNLSHKIPTKYLRGSFRYFAEQLNSLSETAMLSAKKQLKSEQMRTELITNISHDIKTPLTSIINFVDLLKKPHTAEDGQQYLDVLSRQSDRMKKLIEDLMELSKASTGNITVNITEIDAEETVNQALGEFSDKLDSVGLTPVFRHPDDPVMMLADGRLVWRVLSNLLSNAVKYAMPGTRLYIDLLRTDAQVILSMKNVSREELKSSSEALMERFVQGDESRSTDGSGLGLNIAQSLMEVQQGKLHLALDGDLFKVTLVFPGV